MDWIPLLAIAGALLAVVQGCRRTRRLWRRNAGRFCRNEFCENVSSSY